LLLLGGVILGVWIGRRAARGEDSSLKNYQLGKLLRGLFHWTDGFASDVSKYRQLMDSVKQRMTVVEQQQKTNPEPIVTLLSQIVQANDVLQQRLDCAEKALQDQASEIASYLSEARTDTLTGLPNRRVFDDEMSRRLAEFRRSNIPICVLLADIDHFKQFNDRFGHLAGDAVLMQVAKVLQTIMRETDLVARLGGEEFAIVLPSADVGDASQAAERARTAVERAAFQYEGQALRVTISCGAAKAASGEDVTSLVKRADQALYASKSAGRNFAHWHNGRETVPITCRPPKRSSYPWLPAGPTPFSEREFIQVCEELRQRLHSVIQRVEG
jgi:diguanylate cyclase